MSFMVQGSIFDNSYKKYQDLDLDLRASPFLNRPTYQEYTFGSSAVSSKCIWPFGSWQHDKMHPILQIIFAPTEGRDRSERQKVL